MASPELQSVLAMLADGGPVRGDTIEEQRVGAGVAEQDQLLQVFAADPALQGGAARIAAGAGLGGGSWR
jgi:hypothetical protein